MGDLDRLTDGLAYKDLAGRRHLRRYVLAAIAVFALICGIVFLGWRQQQQLLGQGIGAPTGAMTAGQPAEESPTLMAARAALAETQPPSIVPPAEPSSTAISPTHPTTSEACPLDPNEWEFLEIAQSDNFKRIAPPCVYDGLARTVAWDLLRVMGYSATEAADLLGFIEFPWQPMAEIIGLTNTRGPMPIALANPNAEEIKQASHPDFRAWIVDQQGRPGVTFTLRGCYRTETIRGGRAESWGVAYPVICVVTMDQGEWAVLELGSHRYASGSLPTRRFFMYGYTGDERWVSIGYQREPFVEIRFPGTSQPAVLPLTMSLDEIVQDREFIAELLGLSPWDEAWLEVTFGLAMRPLPENWQSLSDPSEYQAIQDEKEKWAKERFP